MPPPRAKIRIATTSGQKYSSLPCPKGCLVSAGFLLFFKPIINNSPLPVSTIEWMPSESIAELPEKKAAVSLVAAIARLPAIAAKTAVLDSSVMAVQDNINIEPGSGSDRSDILTEDCDS